MSDDTELIFICCPDCKSRVPAVAKRCRMCGRILSESEKVVNEITQTEEGSHKKTRVRQRTLSTSNPVAVEGYDKDIEVLASIPNIRKEPLQKEIAEGEEKKIDTSMLESKDKPFRLGRPLDKVLRPVAIQQTPQGFKIDENAAQPRKRRRRRKKNRNTVGVEQVEDTLQQTQRRRIDTKIQQPQLTPGERGTVKFDSAQITSEVLIGWLLKVENNEVRVLSEIKEGRCFVGREHIQPNGLVIPDKSISTPHCLIHADRSNGLRIQDLMSEYGVFVKRAAEGAYQKYADPIVVGHGDWIKFGNYEALVCLVPYTSQGSGK